ncbi:Magnesium and cobalt transport protein CorA [Croceitalea dokdonensis DOKDO 023]|uniref:Magnesium transport protein CorA n=1 Tax=Croceitalea dokdonensis DOKDO 023 TaxID=1300341 RepID=A0A0P7AIT2_9FLAO|nr:magnesium/cobalt transporter CorA [Croceitalea dokdonensis]KPM33504.1 Magnesium and cobalt transport protein CorA [Croceitalea dokdonensis DOKDO 023]
MALKTAKTPKIKIPKQFRSKSKLGKAPGAITYIGNRSKQDTYISVLKYNDTDYSKKVIGIQEVKSKSDTGFTSLVDVVGLTDEDAIAKIGGIYDLNNLLLEDLVDTLQRPKIDEYENYVFGVFKMLYLDGDEKLVVEHVALCLFQDTVLLFQENEDDVFGEVIKRIEKKFGRIRSRGADYLFFALLDAIVDHYFVVLEDIKEKLEVLEDEVYNDPQKESAKKIQYLKKEILRIRKWVFPVKELVNRLIHTEHHLISKETKLFFKDTFDHCLEINEDLVLYREMSTSLMEMYMTNMSNKMNEVMKVLTVMASIFIPLTFFAGIYGMNFEHMPELRWEYGYYYLWAAFILMALGLLIYFKKKDWL